MMNDNTSLENQLERLVKLGEFNKVIECWLHNESSSAQKATTRIHSLVAQAYFEIGDYSKSIIHFKDALSRLSDDDERTEVLLLNNLAVALLHGNSAAAIPEVAQLFLQSFGLSCEIMTDPKFVLPLINLANMYLQFQFNIDLAEQYFLQVISIHSNSFEAWIGLAQVYMNMNEYNDALKCCYRAKKIHPDNVMVLLVCACIKNKTGWPSEAFSLLELARKSYPYEPHVYIALGDFYFSQLMYPQSIHAYQVALKLDSQSPSAADGYIDVLLKTQQYNLAFSIMSKSLYDKYLPISLKKCVLSTCGYALNFPMQMPNHYTNNAYSFRTSHLYQRNSSYLLFNRGNAYAAFFNLLKAHQIDEKELTSKSLLNSEKLNDLANRSPSTIYLLWLLAVHLGYAHTGFIFMQCLFELERKHPLSRQDNNRTTFWYYVALAEAGRPWELLDYSTWLYNEVNKRDNFSFALRIFSYNRMHRKDKQLDRTTHEHVTVCLNQARSPTSSIAVYMVQYEEIMFWIRQREYDRAEELLPSKQSFSKWPPSLQILYARLLYKRKTMINSRQALQTVNTLLQNSPNHDLYILLRLKLLFNTGEMNSFEGYYNDYEPKTYEMMWKKFKLGCKFYLSLLNTNKVQEILKQLKELLKIKIPEWKTHNGLVNERDDIVPLTNFADSYYLLKSKLYLLLNQARMALVKLRNISKEMEVEKLMEITLQITSRTDGYRTALVKSQSYLDTISMKEQSRIWREVVQICIENNLIKQAQSVSALVGASRFPRIDLLLPYMKIAFFLNSLDSLESYLTRVDLNTLTHQARKRKDARPLLAQIQLFRMAVAAHKLRTNISTQSELVQVKNYDETRDLFSSLKDMKDIVIESFKAGELIGHEFKVKMIEILDLYVVLSDHIHQLNQRIRNYDIGARVVMIDARSRVAEYKHILSTLPEFDKALSYLATNSMDNYRAAKDYLSQLLQLPISSDDARNITHNLILKAFLNNDLQVVHRLALTGNGDLTFQNFMRNLAKQIEAPRSLGVVNKELYQVCFSYLVNNFYDLSDSNWRALYHFYSRLPPTSSDRMGIELIKNYIAHEITLSSETESNQELDNFFSQLRLLRSGEQTMSLYVAKVEQLWQSHVDPYYRHHLFRLHLDRCSMNTESPSVNTNIWFLAHSDVSSLVDKFIQMVFEPTSDRYVTLSSSFLVSRIRVDTYAGLSRDYIHRYIVTDSTKVQLLWKAIPYIFSENNDRDDLILAERLSMMCCCVLPLAQQLIAEDTFSVNFRYLLHDLTLKFPDSIKLRYNQVQKKTHGEFILELERLIRNTVFEFYTSESSSKAASSAVQFLLGKCRALVNQSLSHFNSSWDNLLDQIRQAESISSSDNIRINLDTFCKVRIKMVPELLDWKNCYWCLAHSMVSLQLSQDTMQKIYLLIYGFFVNIIGSYARHQRQTHDLFQLICAVFDPKDKDTSDFKVLNFDESKFISKSEVSPLAFISFLDAFFSGLTTCPSLPSLHYENTSYLRKKVTETQAYDLDYEKVQIAFQRQSPTIKAVQAMIPLLLDIQQKLVDRLFRELEDISKTSHLVWKFKEIVLMLSALFESKMVTLDHLSYGLDSVRVLSRSLILVIAFSPTVFEESEVKLVLLSFSHLSNQYGSIFTSVQFLLDLACFAPTSDVLKNAFKYSTLMREISEEIRDAILVLCSVIRHERTATDDDLERSLVSILKREFFGLEIIRIGFLPNKQYDQKIMRLHLMDGNEKDIYTLTQLSREEAEAEITGQFLTERTRSLVTEMESVTHQRVVLGHTLIFQIDRIQDTSLADVIEQSKNSLSNNFTQKDITPWFYNKGAETSFLQWKTETTTKQKKTGTSKTKISTQFMFDNVWYDRIAALIRQVAQWAAVNWICGIWNRQPDYMLVNMELGRFQQKFWNRATGFCLESSIYYNYQRMENDSSLLDRFTSRYAPFRMEPADIKALLRITSNSMTIFSEEFEYCLRTLTERPMNVQHIITSVICVMSRNPYVATLCMDEDFSSVPVYVYGPDASATQTLGSEVLDNELTDFNQIIHDRYVDTYYTQITMAINSKTQIESQMNNCVGDKRLYKLMKRRVKLQIQVEQERLAQITAQADADNQQLETDVSSRENIHLEEALTGLPSEDQDQEQVPTAPDPHVSFIRVQDMMAKCNIDVLERILLRLRKHVVVSSFDKNGMKHCSSVQELASTLMEAQM